MNQHTFSEVVESTGTADDFMNAINAALLDIEVTKQAIYKEMISFVLNGVQCVVIIYQT